MSVSTSEIRTIQYLRAVAAISVVCFHVSETYGLNFKAGAAGVDLFFVISGFIMWVTTRGKSIGPQEFMRRRIVRIVPLYWLATLVTFAMAAAKPQFFFDVDASRENLIGSLLFLPHLQENALHPVVLQGWTLSYEMFFYLIFAASLLLPSVRRFSCLIAGLVIVVLAHQFLPPGYLRAFTEPVILEFAAGVAIGYIWTQGARLPLPVAIGLMIAGLVLLSASDWLPDFDRTVRWGVPSALLLLGAVFAERERSAPRLPFLHFLGDASYSIYIWHALAGILVTALVLRIGISHSLQPLVIILGSLALSVLCYSLIERPMQRRLRSSRPQPAPTG
jgi:exopolysaccharide production protein ExoZ